MALLTNHEDAPVDLDGVDFAGAGAQRTCAAQNN